MNSTLKFAAAAASALFIAACGGSGDKFDSNASAGGGVSKGLIIGGEINIFAIEDGEVGATPLNDTPSLTDENGQYSIRVPSSHSGDPILIRLSMAQDEANEVTTQMKCDLPAGCGGDIGFGDIYTPDAGFVMEAILASANGSVSASITPLTDIGAKLALARLEDNDDNELAATVIEFANSQVANRFGLSGTLTGQEIVDVTDPVSANTASADALRNSALAAAVVAAVQNEQAALSIEEALASFVEEFVDEGIADKDDTPDTTTTTLTEIFQQADAVLAETEQAIDDEFEEGGASENFSSARTEVQNDRDDASGDNGSTTASQGSASPNAGADELAKAKAFVQQIRDLGGNLQDGLEDGAGAAEEMEMIAELNQEDIDVALETTGDSIAAIVDAYDAYEEADEENKPTEYTSENGITVGIAVSGDKYTFTIDQEESQETVGIDMVGVLDFTATADEGDNPEIDNASADAYADCNGGPSGKTDCSGNEDNSSTFGATLRELSIAGDVVVGNATLSILDTTEISGSFSGSEDATFEYEQTTDGESYDYNEEYVYERDVTGEISLDLDVRLTVTASESSETQASEVVFAGGLSAGLTGLQLQETETETYNDNGSGYEFEETLVSELEFDLVTFGLNGSVENDVGTRVAATVNVTIDGRDAVLNYSDSYQETSNNQGFSFNQSSEGFEESEDNFIEASIAVTLVADIEGVSDHTKIEFEGARSEFDSVTASLRVEYGVPGDDDGRLAQHLDVQASVEDIQFEYEDDSVSGGSGGDSEESATTAFVITNQDGVEAELTDNGEDATGTIEVNGTTYATVTPEVIRYIDGTIESF